MELHDFKGLDFSEVYDSAFTVEKEEDQKRNYQAVLDFIERNKGIEVSYDEARFLMEQGKAVASGKWRMQLDEIAELWIADLTPTLVYDWGQPNFLAIFSTPSFLNTINKDNRQTIEYMI
ncbi:hypothetical protein BSK49_10585 [Paenibacillus odorifer]|uniref:Uncharacterized protein n=1 Tax=Paenibacillus odorifer TaxID=189426 RepID=A0ABX3GSD7_9BACL|nr:hypothetical protein [Paenibacillus odorifer]OMD36040.1 hypothetical protein BSO21_07965 [Paenibacillus odorifer]OMD89814.1 hypothetical protein BSK49_10585 [Paenibacillus odorifer]